MLIQLITLVIIVFLLIRLGRQRRRRQVTLKEAIGWGLVWFGAGVAVLYPKLTDRLAALIGLQSAKGIDLVVYVAVGVVFYLVFRLFVRLEKMEHEITKVVRHLALKNDKDESKQ